MKQGRKRRVHRCPMLLGAVLLAVGGLWGIAGCVQNEQGLLAAEIFSQKDYHSMMEQAEIASMQMQENLDDRISDYLAENGFSASSVQYCIEDLTSHRRYEKDAQMNVTAASIYKLPLAMVYYEKIAAGELSEATCFTYEASHYEQGGSIPLRYQVGDQIPLRELLTALILESDNTAGHILFENLGGWTAYKQVISKYSDTPQEAIFFSLNNVTNAAYTADVLAYLYAHEQSFSQLLSDLKQASPGEYLRYVIDEETAQKYGLLGDYRNAAGIVYGEHPYSVAIFTSLGESGSRVIGEINAICYAYFNGEEWQP